MLIRYAGTSHPALVERTFVSSDDGGETGRSLVFTTPLPALSAATRSWNDLFGSDPWPAWLLCRQAIEYLAGRGDDVLMPLVGQTVSLPLGEAAASESRRRIQLFPPGEASPVPLEIAPNAERVTLADIAHSGTYWLRGVGNNAGFSANLPPEATDLERMDLGELDSIFGPEGYNLASNREEIEFAGESGIAACFASLSRDSVGVGGLRAGADPEQSFLPRAEATDC